MPNLVKESKKYGLYHNEFNGNNYQKIQVISVEDIFNGNLIELPNVIKVLRKAEQHTEQEDLL
jgi:site-specific DNA-methyltransferase (adenine-specific)